MLYYLSLGSNLGNREQTLQKAIESLEEQTGKVTRCSSFFYSEPWGFESEHGFCNLCCSVETNMKPMEMLSATQAVERSLGRTHKSVNGHYTDRVIDIDIIRAFDEEGKEIISNDSQLTIPHPLWREREFVTVPLQEILS